MYCVSCPRDSTLSSNYELIYNYCQFVNRTYLAKKFQTLNIYWRGVRSILLTVVCSDITNSVKNGYHRPDPRFRCR